MSQEIPTPEHRLVSYVQWTGIHGSWLPVETSLLAFVYDYHVHVGACGVFPPVHLLNDFLLRGGGGGGMGPGAKWEPFSLSQQEYEELVLAIRDTPADAIEGLLGRPCLVFKFDPDFDGDPATYPVQAEPKRWHRLIPAEHNAYWTWMGAVCTKHRDRWHEELRRAGLMGPG